MNDIIFRVLVAGCIFLLIILAVWDGSDLRNLQLRVGQLEVQVERLEKR